MLKSIRRSSLLAGLLVVPAFYPVAAQQPTEAERDAIRSACRSDFMAHCASVQPGGKEALECLLQNDLKLSAPCKSAVFAVAPKVEPKSESEVRTKVRTQARTQARTQVRVSDKGIGPKGARGSRCRCVKSGRDADAGRSNQSDQASLHIGRLHGALFLDFAKQPRSGALPESQCRRTFTGLPDRSWVAIQHHSYSITGQARTPGTVGNGPEKIRTDPCQHTVSVLLHDRRRQYGRNTDQSAAKCDPSGLPF